MGKFVKVNTEDGTIIYPVISPNNLNPFCGVYIIEGDKNKAVLKLDSSWWDGHGGWVPYDEMADIEKWLIGIVIDNAKFQLGIKRKPLFSEYVSLANQF